MTGDEPRETSAERGQNEPPAPPAAPRPVTAPVRRRAWSERQVHVWWSLGFLLLGIAVYYAIAGWWSWSIERQLITQGEVVDAEILTHELGGQYIRNRAIPKGSGADFRYTFRGETYRLRGFENYEKLLTSGDKIPIRIDPQHPRRWTFRDKPGPLINELMVSILMTPFVLMLLMLAWWRRGQVLRVYRDGEAVMGEVVGVGHSAAAPFSRMVRCAVHVGNDARIVKAILPRGRTPEVGQTIWLIAPAGRPGAGIPAALFE